MKPTPWNSYRRIATQTAQPGQLVLMLYEGAIRFLERALLGFQEEDPLAYHQTIHNNTQRAQSIIAELNASLNMSQGGEVAANLRRLYEYLDWRLLDSNLHKREQGFQEVIQRLTVLRDAWAQMLRQSAGAPTVEGPVGYALTAAG